MSGTGRLSSKVWGEPAAVGHPGLRDKQALFPGGVTGMDCHKSGPAWYLTWSSIVWWAAVGVKTIVPVKLPPRATTQPASVQAGLVTLFKNLYFFKYP